MIFLQSSFKCLLWTVSSVFLKVFLWIVPSVFLKVFVADCVFSLLKIVCCGLFLQSSWKCLLLNFLSYGQRRVQNPRRYLKRRALYCRCKNLHLRCLFLQIPLELLNNSKKGCNGKLCEVGKHWWMHKSQILHNPFHVTTLFLYPLKNSENRWCSDIFRGYRKWPVALDQLNVYRRVNFDYIY